MMRSFYTTYTKVLLSISLMMLAVSCGRSLRQQMIKDHPQWQQKYVEMIKNGNITEGMTKDMVIAAWGHPKLRSEVSGGSYSQQWVYETATTDSYSATYVYFRNGKVVNVE